MKESKIASIVYYIIIAISVVVLALFVGHGFGDIDYAISATANAPRHTDLLLVFMYVLVALTGIAIVVAVIMTKPSAIDTNLPGWGKALIKGGLLLFVPVLLVSWFLGSDEPVKAGDTTSAFWLQLTDAWIYTIYVLMVVTALCLVASLAGIFKKR